MIEGEENCSANREEPRRRGARRRGVRDGWTDGQKEKNSRQQPFNRGLTSYGRNDVKGNRFAYERLKRSHTKRKGRRMEVEDSGCQDWRWDGVRSHFSSVITVSASTPLSSLSNYCHNEAGLCLQSCIWLSGCKAITPAQSDAVFDKYSMCETQWVVVVQVRTSGRCECSSEHDFLWMPAWQQDVRLSMYLVTVIKSSNLTAAKSNRPTGCMCY